MFFGGGTPTQLPSADLVRMLEALGSTFGLVPGAEVTTEANPDSVSPASLAELRDGGFTRISFGVQSAVPHVLATLDRTHDPARVPEAVRWAREAGFEQVSVDLIYGTPGESIDDWAASLDHALELEPDHVSAYALIVEQGTALARRIARGEIAAPDDDAMADKYLMADDMLTSAGLGWYELSNWARDDAAPMPAQPPVLAQRRLVGRWSRSALTRRRRALVERQAPGRLRGTARGGGVADARPRGARPSDVCRLSA